MSNIKPSVYSTYFISVSAAALVSASAAVANPLGASVESGNVDINGLGTSLVVIDNNSNRAIVNWDQFSVGAGETTQINQLGATAAILNRVTGSNLSEIYGTLSSNGQVYLINENGIIIGADGVVDTTGFVASTLNATDADFLGAGDMLFSQGMDAGGGISVLGKIRSVSGGDIFLLSREIEIGAEAELNGGYVGLGAGEEILLRPLDSGEGRISIRAGKGKITNKGVVEGAVAELRAAGGNEYALAINNEGVVRATGASTSGGRVTLTAGGAVSNKGKVVARKQVVVRSTAAITNSGEVEAKGGTIIFEAPEITIEADSLLDVSAALGGGRVFIGGGYQGKATDHAGNAIDLTQNATKVVVSHGARLDATGGGEVVVWSDGSTDFAGDIVATSATGKGGNAEVSGKSTLIYNGTADLRGAGGFGTLLLDPGTIHIVEGAGANTANTFNDDTIETLLGTVDLIIATNSALGADTLDGHGADGDIIIEAGVRIFWSDFQYDDSGDRDNSLLILSAARDIIAANDVQIQNIGSAFNADFIGVGTGGVTLAAGRDVKLGSTTATGAVVIGSAFGTTRVTAGTTSGGLVNPTTVAANAGSVILTGSTTTSGAYAQLGVAFNLGAGDLKHGDIVVRAGKDVILTSGGGIDGDGRRVDLAYAQIGHGGATVPGSLQSIDSDIFVDAGLSTKGSVTLTTAQDADASDYVKIGHGWIAMAVDMAGDGVAISGGDISGNIEVIAHNDGGINVGTTFTPSDTDYELTQHVAQIGHGSIFIYPAAAISGTEISTGRIQGAISVSSVRDSNGTITSETGKVQVGADTVATDTPDDIYAIDSKIGHGARVYIRTVSGAIGDGITVSHGAIDSFGVYRDDELTYLSTDISVSAGVVKILANETAKNAASITGYVVDNGIHSQIGSGSYTQSLSYSDTGAGQNLIVSEDLISGNISVTGLTSVTVESKITAGDIAITNDSLVARLGHGGTAILQSDAGAAGASGGDITYTQANIYKSAISVKTTLGDITVNSAVTAGQGGITNSDAVAVIGSGGEAFFATGAGGSGLTGGDAGDITFKKGTVWDGFAPTSADDSSYSPYDTSITLTSGKAINITTAQAAGLAAINSNTSQSSVGHGSLINLTTGAGGNGSVGAGGRGGDVTMTQQYRARDYGFDDAGADDSAMGLRGDIRLAAVDVGETAIKIDSSVASATAGANNSTALATVGHGDQIAVVAGNGGNAGNGDAGVTTGVEAAEDAFDIRIVQLAGGRGGHVDLHLGRTSVDDEDTNVMLIEGDIVINADGALAVTSAANNATLANNNALVQSQIGHNMHVAARSGDGGNGGASKVGIAGTGIYQGQTGEIIYDSEDLGEQFMLQAEVLGSNRGGNGGDLHVLLGDITDRFEIANDGFSHDTDADSGTNGSDILITLTDNTVADALILTATVGGGSAEGKGADVNALIGHNFRILAEGGAGGNGGSANTQFDDNANSLYADGLNQLDYGDLLSFDPESPIPNDQLQVTDNTGTVSRSFYDGIDETAGQAGHVFWQPNTSGGRGGDALAVTGNIHGDIKVDANSRVTVSTLAGHGGSGQVAAQIGHSTNLFVTTQAGGNAGTMYEPAPSWQQAKFDGGIKPTTVESLDGAVFIDGNKDDAFDLTNIGGVDDGSDSVPANDEDGISITQADQLAHIASTMDSIKNATELTKVKDGDPDDTGGVIFHDEEADPEFILASIDDVMTFVENTDENNALYASQAYNLTRFGRLVATYDGNAHYGDTPNDLGGLTLEVFVDMDGDGAIDLVDFDRDGRLDIVDVDGDGIMDQIDGRANYVSVGSVNGISGIGVLDYVAVGGVTLNQDNPNYSWSIRREIMTQDLAADYFGDEVYTLSSLVGDFATANGGRGGDAYAINGYTVGDISVSTRVNSDSDTASLVVSSNMTDDPTAGSGDDFHRAMIGHAGVNIVDTSGDMVDYIAGRAVATDGALGELSPANGGDAGNYAVNASGGRGGNAISVQGVLRDNNGDWDTETEEADHLVGNIWINTPNALDQSHSGDSGQIDVSAKADTDYGSNNVLAQLGHFAYAWATGATGGNGASKGSATGPNSDSQTEIADGGAGGLASLTQNAIKGSVFVMAGQNPTDQSVSLQITAENGAAIVPTGPNNIIIAQLGHGRAALAVGGAGGNGNDGQASGNGGQGGAADITQGVIIDAEIYIDLVQPATVFNDGTVPGYYGNGMLVSAKDLESSGGITRAQVGHASLALALSGAGGAGSPEFEVLEQINQTANGGAGGAATITQGIYYNDITLDIGSNTTGGAALEVFASENNLFDGADDHTLATIGHGGYANAIGAAGGAGGLSGAIDGINSGQDFNIVDSDYNYTDETTNDGDYSIDWNNTLTLGTERRGGNGGAASILQNGTGQNTGVRARLDYGHTDADGASINITVNDYIEGDSVSGPDTIEAGYDGVLVHAMGGAGSNSGSALFVNAAMIGHSTFAEAVGGQGGAGIQSSLTATISEGDGGDGGAANVSSGRIDGDISVSNVTTNNDVKNSLTDTTDYNNDATDKSTNIVFQALGGSTADTVANTVMARAGHFSQIAAMGGLGGNASVEAGSPPGFTATISAQGGDGGAASTSQNGLFGNITLTAENSVKQDANANNGAAAITTVTAIGHGQSATAVAGAGGMGGTAGTENLYFIYEALREFHARGDDAEGLSETERKLIAPILDYFANDQEELQVFLNALIGSNAAQIAANFRDDDNFDEMDFTVATLDDITQNGNKSAADALMAILAASGHGGNATVLQGDIGDAANGNITINAMAYDLTDAARGYDQTAQGSASGGGAAITQLGHTVNLLQAVAGAGASLTGGNAGANGIGGDGGNAAVIQNALVGAITVNSDHMITIKATDSASGAYQVASYVGHRQMVGSDIVAQRAATVVVGGKGGGESNDTFDDGLNGNGGDVKITQYGQISRTEYNTDIRLLALKNADDDIGIVIESSAVAVGDPDVVTHIGHSQFIDSVKAGDAGVQGGLTGPVGAQGIVEGNGGDITISQTDLGADIDIIARDAIAITAKGTAAGAETAYLLIGHQRTVGASANTDSDQTGTIVAGMGGDSLVEGRLGDLQGDADSGSITINLGILGDSNDAGSRLVTITSITEDVDILAEAALGSAMLEIGNQQQMIAETLEAGNYRGVPQLQTAGDSGSIVINRGAIMGDIAIQALDADRANSKEPANGKQVTVISKTAIGSAQVQIGHEAEYVATTGRSGFGAADNLLADLDDFVRMIDPIANNIAIAVTVEDQAAFADALAAVQNMRNLVAELEDARRYVDRLPANDSFAETGTGLDRQELDAAYANAQTALALAETALNNTTLSTQHRVSSVMVKTTDFIQAVDDFKEVFAALPGGADVVATYADAGDITYYAPYPETHGQSAPTSSRSEISGDVTLASGQYSGSLNDIVGDDTVMVDLFGTGVDDMGDGVVLVKSDTAIGRALTEIGHRSFMQNTTGKGGGDTNAAPEEGGVAGDGGSITLSNETSGDVTLQAEEVVIVTNAALGNAETHLGHTENVANDAGSSDIQALLGAGGDITVEMHVSGDVNIIAEYLASDVDAKDRTLKVNAAPGDTAYLQMGHQVATVNESHSDPNETGFKGDGQDNKGANRGGDLDILQSVDGDVKITLDANEDGVDADLILLATGIGSANMRLGHSGEGGEGGVGYAGDEFGSYSAPTLLVAVSGTYDSDDGGTVDIFQDVGGDVIIANIEDLAIRTESIGLNNIQTGHNASQTALSGEVNPAAAQIPAYGEAVTAQQDVSGAVRFTPSSSFEASMADAAIGALHIGHTADQTARSADDGAAPSDVDITDNGASAGGVNDSFERADVSAGQSVSGDLTITTGEILLSNGSGQLLQLGHVANQSVSADGDGIAAATTGTARGDNPFAGLATGYVFAASVIDGDIALTATGATGQVDTKLVAKNGTQGDITLTQTLGAGGVQVGHRSIATTSDATPNLVAEGFYLTLQGIGAIETDGLDISIDSSLSTITLTAAQDIEMLGLAGGVIEVGHYIDQTRVNYAGAGPTSPVAVNANSDAATEDSTIAQVVASNIALNAGNNVVMTSTTGTTLVGHSSSASNEWQVEGDRSVTPQVLGGAIRVISGLDTAKDAPNGLTTVAGDELGLGDDMLLDGTAGGSVRIGHLAPAIGVGPDNATQIAVGDIWVQANGDLAVKTANIGHANYDFASVAVTASNATSEGLADGIRDRIVGDTTIGAGQNSPDQDSTLVANIMVLDKAIINSGYGGIGDKDTGGKLRFFLPAQEGLTITESVFNDSGSNGDAVPDRVSNAGNVFTAEGGTDHEHDFALMSTTAAYTDQYIGAGNFTFYFEGETATTVDTPYLIYTPTAGRFTAFTVRSRGPNGAGTGSAINIGNLDQTSVSSSDSTVPENCDDDNAEACVTQEYQGLGTTQNSGVDDGTPLGLIPVADTNPSNFLGNLLQSLRSSLFGGNNI